MAYVVGIWKWNEKITVFSTLKFLTKKNLICGLFSKSVKCSRTYNYVFYADFVREIKIFGITDEGEFGLHTQSGPEN